MFQEWLRAANIKVSEGQTPVPLTRVDAHDVQELVHGAYTRPDRWNEKSKPFEVSGAFSRFYSPDKIMPVSRLLMEKFFEAEGTDHAKNCRLNLGVLQGSSSAHRRQVSSPGLGHHDVVFDNVVAGETQERASIITVECNTKSSLKELKNFVKQNAEILEAYHPGRGYINLALENTQQFAEANFGGTTPVTSSGEDGKEEIVPLRNLLARESDLTLSELQRLKQKVDPMDVFYVESGIHPVPSQRAPR